MPARACMMIINEKRGSADRVTPCFLFGGAEQDRTVDLLTASQALSQLSYSPTSKRSWFLPDHIFYVNHFYAHHFYASFACGCFALDAFHDNAV